MHKNVVDGKQQQDLADTSEKARAGLKKTWLERQWHSMHKNVLDGTQEGDPIQEVESTTLHRERW